MLYRLILVTVVLVGSLAAQDTVSTQSLKATFSNLDKESVPYTPDGSPGHTAPQDPRPRRPTLGAIADFQETYGLPILASPQPAVFYPVFPVGVHISHPHHTAPVGHIAGHTGHRR